jgi:hypothetical protein
MATDRLSVVRDPIATTGYSVSYTGTAGVTTAYNPGASTVMVWCTTDAYIKVGEAVTATTADTPVPAYTPMWFPVPAGSGAPFRVSAIQISAGGIVYTKPFN